MNKEEIEQLQQENNQLKELLDIANNKLKEVKEKCNKELNWIMVEYEGKISNARHVNDLEDILSIIGE